MSVQIQKVRIGILVSQIFSEGSNVTYFKLLFLTGSKIAVIIDVGK